MKQEYQGFLDYFSEMYTISEPEKEIIYQWHESMQIKLINEIMKVIENEKEECEACENKEKHDTYVNKKLDIILEVLSNLKSK